MTNDHLQLFLELLVREFVQQVELAVHVEHPDVGVAHSIEERRLHHGVVDHVLEDDGVADLQGLVEGKISELVTGETSISC